MGPKKSVKSRARNGALYCGPENHAGKSGLSSSFLLQALILLDFVGPSFQYSVSGPLAFDKLGPVLCISLTGPTFEVLFTSLLPILEVRIGPCANI